MSDFLKKFKSVFVVDDDSAQKRPIETTSSMPEGTPQNGSSPSAPPPAPPPAAIAGSLNEKAMQALLSALEAANQPGFDYFEYRNSLQSLSKMPMDESTRFKSAFAMAQTMGATPAQLVASAQNYLGVLKGEQEKFNQSAQAQRSKLVGAKEQESQNLEGAIQQKAEQIKRLTDEISAHQKQVEALRREIAESAQKVETAIADFSATYANVVEQINGDIDKMKIYLK